jgi:hypothetical protein
MDYSRLLVRLSEPLPELTALRRDRLLIRVGHVDPLLLIRSLPPNWGCVGEAIARGEVYPIEPVQPVEEIMRLVASADGPSLPLQLARRPQYPTPTRHRVFRLRT